MSHSYGNGNSNGNNYLSRKRLEEDIPNESRYHYDRYDKYDKYGNHSRYNNMNYIHSKPLQGNNYYNSNSRYRNNYYNNPRPFHGNGYPNKMTQKRDYKKPYQKYTNPIANEEIRNLSHCEMPSPPPPSSQNIKQDGDSFKSISSSTGDSKSSFNGYNDGIKVKDINRFGPNISPHISSGRGQNIFQNNQDIRLSSSSPCNIKYKEKRIIPERKEENNKWKKEDENDDEDEEIPIFNFPKPSYNSYNYEPFDRNSIDIEENPLDNFELYPKSLYELNNIPKKINSLSVSNSMFKNYNKENEKTLSIKSCYLLAKIPNWRLVTNFVPASSLTEEKFKNISCLEEMKEDDDITEDLDLEKYNTDTKDENKKKKSEKKSYLVYFQKYEDVVDKYLEKSVPMKRQVKKDIFNKKYIIAQYHYDILKYKNKIKQNKYKINYLNIKQENTRNGLGLDDKIKE